MLVFWSILLIREEEIETEVKKRSQKHIIGEAMRAF